MAAWIPQSFQDACKRNAGRRKLHRRKRHARADRILRILASMDSAGATELRDTTYGLLAPAAQAMEVSKATISRDFALVRRIHRQFGRMFGRDFDAKSDKIFWSWDWSYYGFMTQESTKAGYREAVGHFPFDTRKQESEESYVGSLSCPGTTAISPRS
jgi:hypothetical protein